MSARRRQGGGKNLVVAAAVGLAVVAAHGHHGLDLSGFSGHPSANVRLGERMAARRGWTGGEWSCLYTLWQGESGWDKYNTYPSHDTPPSTPGDAITTAYGIPQALPAQKMAAAGPNWQTSARTQIHWGLDYISHTYGTPCSALAFKRASGNKGY